ncbi:hypothetical protein CDL12_10405 [Handroanthus impetiginosus]|uniref:Uncharacterized protein n=1 Tax=Handroanthus impetiginosus TaxID=429701 RepID=A0A2G9HHE9_9LAMI|nr:hypothetical protein CDL12_10405 [Handroanthus impetiginosus]
MISYKLSPDNPNYSSHLYPDINPFEADNPLIFQDEKNKIQAYYNSKRKTWIAEFSHTHFRTPRSIATLIATTCILVLTTLQTIYIKESYFKGN